jgi:type I restriction enzyme S subunit
MNGIKVLLPPLPEQKRIVDLISSVDSYIGALEQQLESAKKSRNAVLHKTFHTDRSNWKIQKLDECTQKISDGSHNPPKGIEHSEFLMLSSKDVWDGYLTNLDPRFLKQSDFEIENKRTQLESGDVLLTVVGTIGRCAVYRGNPKNVTFQRSVCVIKTTKDVLNESFLMMYLQSIQSYLDQNARGVAQRGIYLNQIRDLEVPIPELKEQFAVVSNIEVFDNFIQETQNVVAQTQKLRASILSDLLSGKHEIPAGYDKVIGAA